MSSFRTALALLLFLALFAGGCSRQSASSSPDSESIPVLKVSVFADGRLIVDGRISTLQAFRESLQRTGVARGVVWYYRESGTQGFAPMAAEVTQALEKAGLPVRLSNQASFSDCIGPDGRPIRPTQPTTRLE